VSSILGTHNSGVICAMPDLTNVGSDYDPYDGLFRVIVQSSKRNDVLVYKCKV